MLLRFSEPKKEKLYFVLIAAAGLLRFVNLGFKDLQAWDEALYAVRAEGILRFGHFVDQTSFAIDGLYSSLHPPLYVWLTVISFRFLGVNEFAARFFSAMLGFLTLFLIYRIGKKLADADTGFLAAMLYGLNPFVSFYARQGQFDTALVSFLTLSIYYLTESSFAQERQNVIRSGLSVGAALMTKLYVGLGIPLAYAISIFFKDRAERQKALKNLGILLVAAFLVALPWYVYMTVVHGQGNPLFFFNASALWDRAVSGIEGNVQPLEIFYFVNQLVVLFPLGVVWLLFGLRNTVRSRENQWQLPALWFVTFFVVFSLLRTKLAVYLLPMLVPASLFSAKEIQRAAKGEISSRTVSLLVMGTLFSVLWASNQAWRNAVKDLLRQFIALHLPQAPLLLSLFPFFLLTFSIIVVFFLFSRDEIVQQIRPFFVPLILIPSLVFSLYQVGNRDRIQWNDGGHELAHYIQEHPVDRIVVAGYERNPQLSYYLGGADIGWRPELDFRRIFPPRNRTEFRGWLLRETMNEPPSSLLVTEKDKFIRYETVDALEFVPPDFELVFESRRYAGFSREKNLRMAQN